MTPGNTCDSIASLLRASTFLLPFLNRVPSVHSAACDRVHGCHILTGVTNNSTGTLKVVADNTDHELWHTPLNELKAVGRTSLARRRKIGRNTQRELKAAWYGPPLSLPAHTFEPAPAPEPRTLQVTLTLTVTIIRTLILATPTPTHPEPNP
jgi:hypothetical protein